MFSCLPACLVSVVRPPFYLYIGTYIGSYFVKSFSFYFYPRNFALSDIAPPFKRQNMSVLECARTSWEKVVGSADGGLDAALFLDAAQAVANVLDLLTGMGMVKSDMQVRHLPASAAVLTNSCPAPRLLL